METNATRIAMSNQWEFPEPGTGDRLSSLPDEILSLILSFLQTKYAVGTAVLSRRWKDLWTRVSNLDLDDSLVYHHQPPENNDVSQDVLPEQISEIQESKGSAFSRFVDRVLSQHKNLDSVRRFRLQVMSKLWFKMDLGSGSLLEEIDLKLQGGVKGFCCEFHLPESFYTLRNLKVLKLGRVIIANTDGSVVLPNLKILQLVRVEVEDCESLRRLISHCPVLETLHLELCYLPGYEKEYMFIASSLSLKNLTMIHRNCGSIVIEAPSLEYLHLDIRLKPIFELRFLTVFSCLESAWIDIDWNKSELENCVCMVGLLNQISNARRICLSYRTLDSLSLVSNDDGFQLPVFPNLTHLTTEAPLCSGLLHSLLHSASKLQSLVIHMKIGNGIMGGMRWEPEPACLPECLSSSLEEIVITHFISCTRLVAYLLKFGAVLKKLSLQWHSKYNLYRTDLKRLASLLELPRRSSACEVRFLHHDGSEIDIDGSEIDIDGNEIDFDGNEVVFRCNESTDESDTDTDTDDELW